MGIDASIALNANRPTPPDPIAALGSFGKTASLLTTAKANQLTIAGAQAQAQAYRDNTDDQGNTDFPAMLGELAKLPGGAYALPEASAAVLARQKSQLDLNQAQLNQTENRTSVFNSALTPLIRLGSSVTPQDVYSTIAGLANSGFPAKEFAADAATTMPILDPTQADNPQARAQYGQNLASWVFNHAGRSWGAAVGVDASKPNFQTQDTGGGIRMVDTNPFTNPTLATGGEDTNKTLSPTAQTDQVTLTDPSSGRTYSIPRAQLAGMQGQGSLVPPGNAPGGASPFGSGRYGQVPGMGGAAGAQGGAAAGGGSGGGSSPFDGPGVGGPSAFGGAAGASLPPSGMQQPSGGPQGMSQPPSSAGMPPGAVMTGIGPASAAARTQLGTQAGNEAASLFSTAQGVPDRKAQLSDLEADLAQAPTGPGAQNQAYWSAFANRNFPSISKLIPGVVNSPDQVASFENFEKVAGRLAQSQAATLGAVTNDKLGASVASNPNAAFSTLGNSGVIHILQGNEDAIAAKNNAWQSYLNSGGDPANYQSWSTSFNNSGFDPRVFWMKNMTPQERSSYLGTLSPSQASSFYSNVRTGMANGWVSPSDFAPPGSASGSSQGAAPNGGSGQPPTTAAAPSVPTGY